MKRRDFIVFVLLVLVSIAAFIIFELKTITFFEDPLVNNIFCGTIARLIYSVLLIHIISTLIGSDVFNIKNGGFKGLLWAIPCIIVGIVNFPFSALISGKASIIRPDVLILYIFYIVSIAIYEELFFRGLIFEFLYRRTNFKKYKYFIIVLISGAIFAAYHLTNLFFGGDVLGVLLQVGYSFLVGCMLSVVMLKTRNIFICIGFHAIFDFGGLLISEIGQGNPWDTVFWILTAVAGVFCAVHIVMTLVKIEKRDNI